MKKWLLFLQGYVTMVIKQHENGSICDFTNCYQLSSRKCYLKQQRAGRRNKNGKDNLEGECTPGQLLLIPLR